MTAEETKKRRMREEDLFVMVILPSNFLTRCTWVTR